MSAIAKCQHCGGPAHWTVDKDGDVWYICQVMCIGFTQGDLFDQMEPIWARGVYASSEGDDTYYEGGALDPKDEEHPEDDLPF